MQNDPTTFSARVKNLIGQRFGRLVVTAKAGLDKNRYVLWQCQCDCGKEKIARSGHLLRGSIASCGCKRRQVLLESRTTHGKYLTPEYRTWGAMLARCCNKNLKHYQRYGGRGIQVCERWHEFKNFLADMGNRPSAQHSLDRIDSNGNYEPSNCRWATPKEQSRNVHTNRLIEFNGKTQCLSAWAEELGIHYSTLQGRIRRWPIEKALTVKVRERKRKCRESNQCARILMR